MPALIPTDYFGTITWLGAVMQRKTVEIETEAIGHPVNITWDGIDGAAHTGRTRASDSRVLSQHPKGTQIANVRALTIVAAEDLSYIAAELGLEVCKPEWLGANIVVQEFPDFSYLPPSSRLQADNGTTLIIDMQNHPCQQVAKTIEAQRPGKGKRFKDVAKGRRGVTAWTERPGQLCVGDRLQLHMPGQRGWEPWALF
ncbi:MAG: MOSC domain-containing protein [Planktomarina sp.]